MGIWGVFHGIFRVAEAPLRGAGAGAGCRRARAAGAVAPGGHQDAAPRGVHAEDPKVQDLTQVNGFTWDMAWNTV